MGGGLLTKRILFSIFIIILITSAIIGGVSFAYWRTSFEQVETNEIATECFKMEINGSDAINLQNAMSILNSEGEKLKPYKLTIKNICENEVDYQVNLETLSTNAKLQDQYITLKVNNDENKILNTYTKTSGIIEEKEEAYRLYKGHLKKDQVMNFEIRMWIGEEVEATEEAMNKTFESKVTVEAVVNNKDEIYTEDILNGTDPVLKEGLIPVVIKENGEVYRADSKKAWYNYADKKWANAVILEEGIEEPKIGEKIEESEIESYFVWIPKYSYQLWDLGNYTNVTEIDENQVHTIPIRFGIRNTNDVTKGECETPMNEDKTQGLSGASNNCEVGEYMTHPAFISFSVNGLWVGKFETGYRNATKPADAQVDSTETDKVIIKPNVYSWRSIALSNAFDVSYKYRRDNLDSHMMKNTEWGAVAYLSHSDYGINQEVRINNNSFYITGYAAKEEPKLGDSTISIEGNRYEGIDIGKDGDFTIGYFSSNQEVNKLASTTGNKTGIYDMSGETWEYVIGYTKKSSLEFFDGEQWKKYYDVYSSSSSSDYNQRILGDATGEIGPFGNLVDPDNGFRSKSSWYKDGSFFLNSGTPWFVRGGTYNNGLRAGIFTFSPDPGKANQFVSFRIVLAPQKN